MVAVGAALIGTLALELLEQPLVETTVMESDTVPEAAGVKVMAFVPLPPVVVTEVGPVVAPAGTTAVIWVALLIVNEAAGVPLNDTPLVPMKLVPVMVTLVPAPPLDGVKPVMVGALVVKHFPAEATL